MISGNRVAWLHHAESGAIALYDSVSPPPGALQELQSFEYTRACTGGQEDVTLQGGCACRPTCTQCTCQVECSKGLAAIEKHGRSAGVVCLLECGPACRGCGPACGARHTQQGLAVPVVLTWNEHKGWCVMAGQDIRQGAFVCEYAGEYVASTEAAARLQAYDAAEGRGHALLTVRLQLPSQTTSLRCCIDATKSGNVARFINHSCDGGNLEPVLVVSKGSLLPRVALFAATHITTGTELTFAYASAAPPSRGQAPPPPGEDPGAAGGASRRRCFCGTDACTGFLPTVL